MKHCIFYFLLVEVEDKFMGLCSHVVFKQGIDCRPIRGETVRRLFKKGPVLGALNLNKKKDVICNTLFEVWRISLMQLASCGGQDLTDRDTYPFLQLLHRTWWFLLSLVN